MEEVGEAVVYQSLNHQRSGLYHHLVYHTSILRSRLRHTRQFYCLFICTTRPAFRFYTQIHHPTLLLSFL